MKLVLITGMSGAGKSQASRCLEDVGFFCMDNIPPMLIGKFMDLCDHAGGIDRAAIVVDIRGGEFFEDAAQSFEDLNARGIDYDILYLDATDAVLIKRFKETRRVHPLMGEGQSLIEAIHTERHQLEDIKDKATRVIDTSLISIKQLHSLIERLYSTGPTAPRFSVLMTSFGFKYGVPTDADLVFDVRFLPNPFYQQSLRALTGQAPEVRDYVFSFEETTQFVDKVRDLLVFLLPHYMQEGKKNLSIAFGCTGGMHRSVAISEEIGAQLQQLGHHVVFDHRDAKTEQSRVQ